MKIDPQQKYAVIEYDSIDGSLHFKGIAIGAVLINNHKCVPHFSSNNEIFELDEDGNIFAIPCDGKPYQPKEGT